MKTKILDFGFGISDITRALPPPGKGGNGGGAAGSPMRRAFTLVEMLVAVGLVVLMMTLFATIFGMATGAMSTQKGLAENDQRVRLVLTRLRNDLNGRTSTANDPSPPRRTFRYLVPFGPDENLGDPNADLGDRQGYLYISENDPNDDTDDVLALTVQFPTGSSDLFFGRAAVVFADGLGNYGPVGASPTPGPAPYPPAQPALPAADPLQIAAYPQNGQSYWPNQPEFDDIQGTPNGAGDSQFAEVCYFLRRGTLYRRVMLIRQPNLGSTFVQDGTPTDNTPTTLNVASVYGAVGTPISRNFWTDFDYSAYFNSRVTPQVLQFHGTGQYMNINSLAPASTVPSNPFTLGNPAYRFGFDSSTVLSAGVQVPSLTYGQPREYVTTPNTATPPNTTFFIGRFTHSETSDPTFGYPGNLSTNPMYLATPLAYNPTTGAVGPNATFAGPRGGEDALMTNVLKFDIKIFDPAASVGPDGFAGVAGVDDDGDGNIDVLANGNIDIKELGWPGSDDGDFRDLGHPGTTGFYNSNPQNVPITMQYTGLTAASTTLAGATAYSNYPNMNYHNPAAGTQGTPGSFKNRYDTWNSSLSLTNTIVAGAAQHEPPPYRPFNFGPDGRPGSATAINPISGIAGDDDGNGVVDNAAEIGWPGTDDQPYPLTAIQIKITFYDRTSKQVRETTMVESLAEYTTPTLPARIGSYKPFP